MADKGISVISHNGEDYNINDPNIAGEFYPNSNYAVGDHVTHEGKLYVFTAAHTGAWTGTDVTQVQIGAELHDYGAHAMVRYDVAQTLTDAQKTVARSNIAAANAELEDKIGTVPSGTTVENQIFAQGTQISTNASNIDALQRQVGTVPTGETVEGQIGDLKSAIGEVREQTKNLWLWGDKSFVKKLSMYDVNIPAGTYTLSSEILRESSASVNTNARMVFYKNYIGANNELANPFLKVNAGRESSTFTLSDKADIIVIFSSVNESQSSDVDASWKNIQIEAGSSATPYVPPISGVDYIARSQLEKVTPVVTDQSDVATYALKNKSDDQKVSYKFDFQAGAAYTVSAKITSTDTGTESWVSVTDAYSHVLLTTQLPHDGERQTYTFTAPTNAARIYFWAASTKADSAGKTVTVTNVEIAEGSSAAPVFPDGVTAIDYVARSKIDSINIMADNPFGNVVAENVTIANDAADYELEDVDLSLGTIVVSCDATFTRLSGVTDYPRIILWTTNARNLGRQSTYYKIGEEGTYELKEWRVPAFVWGGKRTVTLHIVVPEGCTLTIRKMTYCYDSSVDRTQAKGVRFFARPGTCNFVPEMTRPALMMAYKHGYDTFTVIPKISSDGVWFAYHDDTWDISSTQLKNPNGTAITDTSYNGQYFHEIPFSHLQQFSAGAPYGTMFADVKVTRLEDICAFLAKTGMKLRFSMHPARGINTSANLASLKRLVQKYGLLKDLTLIVNDITSLFAAFGNDIGGYCFPNSTGASWEDGAENPVNKGFVNAKAAKETYSITVPINCGLWSDSLFANRAKAEELVTEILDEGFTAGLFTYIYTGIDGASHNVLWAEDAKWAMSIGIIEFTEGYNTSIGLNW